MISTQNTSQEIIMVCEHPNCNNTEGNDYKRKIALKGWGNEPIFLCDKHSVGYEKVLSEPPLSPSWDNTIDQK